MYKVLYELYICIIKKDCWGLEQLKLDLPNIPFSLVLFAKNNKKYEVNLSLGKDCHLITSMPRYMFITKQDGTYDLSLACDNPSQRILIQGNVWNGHFAKCFINVCSIKKL